MSTLPIPPTRPKSHRFCLREARRLRGRTGPTLAPGILLGLGQDRPHCSSPPLASRVETWTYTRLQQGTCPGSSTTWARKRPPGLWADKREVHPEGPQVPKDNLV